MKKSKKKINLKTWLIGKLRSNSLQWPPRNEALKLARVDRGRYKCATCSEIYQRKDVHLDHIEPIVDVEKGFENWDIFISRMFCDEEGFQVLCKYCHDTKTEMEKVLREKFKKKKKEK